MFFMVNLASNMKVDPVSALSRANDKFERRFRGIETALKAEGRAPSEASLAEMEALWVRIKGLEKAAKGS